MDKRISVRLSDSLFEALKTASEFYGRHKSEIAREAICEWLERMGFLKER